MCAIMYLIFAAGAIWFSRRFLHRYMFQRKKARKERERLIKIARENERNLFQLQKLLILAEKRIGEIFEIKDYLPMSSLLIFENASMEVNSVKSRLEQLKRENDSDSVAVRSKLKDYDFEQRISELMGKLHSLKLEAEIEKRKSFKLHVVKVESGNAKK